MAITRETLTDKKYDFIGNLDADMTFGPDYFKRVLDNALADPQFGIAGGGAYSVRRDGLPVENGFIQPDFVGGPLQFFRKQCLDDIGGYQPYDYADVIAVYSAKMKGWEARCFPEIRASHHGQPGNTIREKVPICFGIGGGLSYRRGAFFLSCFDPSSGF